MQGTTPSQTVGPFFSIGCSWMDSGNLASAAFPGERIAIRGRMLDGDGKPVADGLIEIWQADPAGRFDNPAFRGFGRISTQAEGRFAFTTVRPGRIAAPGGPSQAAHLLVTVFARGMLKHAMTRLYFPDDPAHAEDPVLSRVEPARRATLIARKGADALEWDIVLQGRDETVFFDL
ncbi:protocatechuate 3,4-dioxygenase subunit alpha [Betaproteobacteria bacterium GR16-43]|nr:protocatechuate 3,4-dioxygenase subunit alpha [Betaproteobacteria bacterium GR16-43]